MWWAGAAVFAAATYKYKYSVILTHKRRGASRSTTMQSDASSNICGLLSVNSICSCTYKRDLRNIRYRNIRAQSVEQTTRITGRWW
jgi:hypothetical protein